MTIGENLQRVQSLYSSGVQSDDSRLSSRHIYNKLLSVRAKLITQKINKKQQISQWNYQPLRCVELIEVPIHECPCLPPIGCKILRTKYKLPKPLNSLTSHMLKSVTSIDGQIVFGEISWIEKKYSKGNKYTSQKPDYFIRDGYLFITVKNESSPMLLYIEGLFEDPIEVYEFTSFCDCGDGVDTECIDVKDLEFPIDLEQVDTLIELAAKELVEFFLRVPEDKTNDSRDKPEELSR